MEVEMEEKSCTVMALLDGGMLKRHKSWLKVLCFSLFHSLNHFPLVGNALLFYMT